MTTHQNSINRIMTLVVMIFLSTILVMSGSASADTPPVSGAIPATPVTTTKTTPGPTTTTITSSKTTELIREFEKRTKRKVVFYWVEKGIKTPKGQKDYDPVKAGIIKVGDKFSNTWVDASGNPLRFWDKWRKGDKLVNVRRGKDKIGSYIEGTIKRCGNKRVRIYLSQKKVKKKKIKKVSEWKSKERFIEKNAENISTNSTSTTVHTMVYTCPEGYTLNGTWCYPPAKDSTKGPGTGSPGTPGGSGSGGTPEIVSDPAKQDDGSRCLDPKTNDFRRDPKTGEIIPGKSDQFGYCV